ncbi:YitT family protein [Curvibacter sp. APW13]|uniref:YitT family protein n=1 Tax=Curvibacter sp. APW13 TaxID=3077236 RepID=UPI0028DF0E3D|nr:YitT family protein [Curvibacter sp. APW13]MDT8989732.1 YitT family protein [Curvibacter sp. APW13]
MSSTPSTRHRRYEDVLALLTGTLFAALGVLMFKQIGLVTGGTTGIAFLLHYGTGWNFGAVFFVLNLPFYLLAWRRMGPAFTVKTFAAVALLAVFTNALPQWIHFDVLHPLLATLLGGSLIGCGMLILFRHRASLGGFNVLVLYLQERYGWRAGMLQMALDCSIVLVSFFLRDWQLIALSVLGAVVVNQTLATNHRAGRYVAM